MLGSLVPAIFLCIYFLKTDNIVYELPRWEIEPNEAHSSETNKQTSVRSGSEIVWGFLVFFGSN